MVQKDYFMRNLVPISIFILSIFNSSWAVDFRSYNSAYMLQVTKSDRRQYICSSVAVSRNKLLTAAHCLQNAVKIRVFREYQLTANNHFYSVQSYARYMKYNKGRSNFLYDIGVIKLKEKLPVSTNIHPIISKHENIVELHRVGFGLRNGLNTRTVISPITQFKLETQFIDALDEYSYSGDSGGPIFSVKYGRFSLVAIHSTKDGPYTLNPRITDEIKEWVESY